MAKNKKRDFWDDVDDEIEVSKTKQTVEVADKEVADDRFYATKCLPLKVVMRALLFICALVMMVSGYICWKYIEDRYDGGYTNSYFSSNGFSEAYNESVLNVIKMIDAIEKDPALSQSQETFKSLADSMLGSDDNFSFLIQDDEKVTLYVSGEDAKSRIESSNHFLRINTANNEFIVDVGGVPTSGLNKAAWKTEMDRLQNNYIIYTSVENNLAENGRFYESYASYQDLTNYFKYARLAIIVSLVLFILLLIYCVMSTGMKKGYANVQLSLFDKVFTEIAMLLCVAALGALIYGMWFVHARNLWPAYRIYVLAGGAVLFYIVLIRSYFSLVRRIKSGHFVADSIIYRIGHAINMVLNHLPKVLKVIIIFIFLVALNGALVYALLFMRGITVSDIPVVFIVAPVVFVIELICFVCCLFGNVPEKTLAVDDNSEEETVAPMENDAAQDEVAVDWSDVDFGKAIPEIEEPIQDVAPVQVSSNTQENVILPNPNKTVVLSQKETEMIQNKYQLEEPVEKRYEIDPELMAKGEDRVAAMQKTQILDIEAVNAAVEENEDALVDFIELNKDVRKMYRVQLKNKSLGVTLRAPQKPILLDIDKSNAIKVLSLLFDNVEKYAQEGTRVFIEMYTQKGKMVYMMKNTIREDLIDQVNPESGESLKLVKKIVQSEGGKFITAVDGNIFKAGILLPEVK